MAPTRPDRQAGSGLLWGSAHHCKKGGLGSSSETRQIEQPHFSVLIPENSTRTTVKEVKLTSAQKKRHKTGEEKRTDQSSSILEPW